MSVESRNDICQMSLKHSSQLNHPKLKNVQPITGFSTKILQKWVRKLAHRKCIFYQTRMAVLGKCSEAIIYSEITFCCSVSPEYFLKTKIIFMRRLFLRFPWKHCLKKNTLFSLGIRPPATALNVVNYSQRQAAGRVVEYQI